VSQIILVIAIIVAIIGAVVLTSEDSARAAVFAERCKVAGGDIRYVGLTSESAHKQCVVEIKTIQIDTK
jgi:threonine aldolase